MAIDTKPNLNSGKFEQCVGDILPLSGGTQVFGKFIIESGGTISILSNAGEGKIFTSDGLGNGTWSANLTACNGLTIVNKTVQLGGALTGDTLINVDNGMISFNDTNFDNIFSHYVDSTDINHYNNISKEEGILTVCSECVGFGNIGVNYSGFISTTTCDINIFSSYQNGDTTYNGKILIEPEKMCLSTTSSGCNDAIIFIERTGMTMCVSNSLNDFSSINITESGITMLGLPNKTTETNVLYIDDSGKITKGLSGGGGTGSTDIISSNNQIIFNNNDVISGNTNLQYIHDINALQVGQYSQAIGDFSVAMADGSACGYGSVAMAFGHACGIHSVAMAQADAIGECSVAMAHGQACGVGSVAMANSTAYGLSSVAMTRGEAYGHYSVAMASGKAYGSHSVAMAQGEAYGEFSVAMACGATCGDYSLVHGQNNILESGNTNSVLLGGSYITVPADLYPNTVIVSDLAIWNTPSGSGDLLAWDSVTKRVCLSSGGTGSGGTGVQPYSPLTSGSSVTWNTNQGTNRTLLIGVDFTLALTNLLNGMSGDLRLEVTSILSITLPTSRLNGSVIDLTIGVYHLTWTYDGTNLEFTIAKYL